MLKIVLFIPCTNTGFEIDNPTGVFKEGNSAYPSGPHELILVLLFGLQFMVVCLILVLYEHHLPCSVLFSRLLFVWHFGFISPCLVLLVSIVG